MDDEWNKLEYLDFSESESGDPGSGAGEMPVVGAMIPVFEAENNLILLELFLAGPGRTALRGGRTQGAERVPGISWNILILVGRRVSRQRWTWSG